jgi:UPF0716 protein FxsA
MIALGLFLLFTVVPLLETWLLIEVGRAVGGAQTVFWLFAMGVAGAWLGKRAGTGVLRQVQQDLRSGKSPADSVIEGLMVVIGSVLLITPGLMSDLTGLLLFIPPVRRWLAPRFKGWMLRWLAGRGSSGGFSFSVGGMGPGPGMRTEAGERGPSGDPAPRAGGPKKTFDHPSF